MTYKNRLKFLLSLIAALLLLYAGSFIFSSEISNTRSASYTWLDEKHSAVIDRIVIKSETQDIELVKQDQQWFLLYEQELYPARKLRIDDFLGIFTQRNAWPVRSTNSSSHANFGLQAHNASRVIFYGGPSAHLDILAGNYDSSGREVYVRKYTQDEVRSGDNRVRTYISNPVTSWFNLRLFPESENGGLRADSVQRLTVNLEGETQIFSRNNRTWNITGIEGEDSENESVESYINGILNTEGNDFAGLISNDDSENDLLFGFKRFEIEFSNGSIITVNFTEPDESGSCYAYVSGREYIYSIPAWAASRLTFGN